MLDKSIKLQNTAPLYSSVAGFFFENLDEVKEFSLDTGIDINSMQLVECDPVYFTELDINYFSDDLPDDADELPEIIQEAVDELNKVLHDYGVASWYPSNRSVEISKLT